MKVLKTIWWTLVLLVITIGAFGGGVLYWLGFCWLVGIEGLIAEIGVFIVGLGLMPLCWWLTPKLSDKVL